MNLKKPKLLQGTHRFQERQLAAGQADLSPCTAGAIP